MKEKKIFLEENSACAAYCLCSVVFVRSNMKTRDVGACDLQIYISNYFLEEQILILESNISEDFLGENFDFTSFVAILKPLINTPTLGLAVKQIEVALTVSYLRVWSV